MIKVKTDSVFVEKKKTGLTDGKSAPPPFLALGNGMIQNNALTYTMSTQPQGMMVIPYDLQTSLPTDLCSYLSVFSECQSLSKVTILAATAP